MQRRGRWRTGQQSRQRILAAARSGFARDGFDRTTMRAIAAEAGVDPAVIHYFFKTKDQLFAHAMRSVGIAGWPLGDLVDEGIDELAARLLVHVLSVWDAADDLDPLIALVRSAPTHQGSAAMLRDLIHQALGARLALVPGLRDIDLRLELFSSQLIGLLNSRYILRAEPIASADPETVIRWVGPVLQAYLTGPAPR